MLFVKRFIVNIYCIEKREVVFVFRFVFNIDVNVSEEYYFNRWVSYCGIMKEISFFWCLIFVMIF